MQVNHICFIVNGYPLPTHPYKYTFVDQLVQKISDLGVECTVINPIAINNYITKELPDEFFIKKTINGNEIKIICPRFISFSNKKIGPINTSLLTLHAFQKAAEKAIKKHNILPDIFYGHFLFPSGTAVINIAKKRNIPSFVAYGESSTWSIEPLGEERNRKILKNVSGIIAVSSKNKELLVTKNLVEENKIEVFPNGVDLKKFKAYDKEKMRKKYSLPQNKFIIAYLGSFTYAKGIMRLSEAAKNIKNTGIIYMGGGSLKPEKENLLFSGKVAHDKVPELLSAADIFVLPTLEEGCCNAIIEALACGLPVVSSDRKFNDEILDKESSIRVNPLNVDEIRNAILKLKNNKKLRKKMSRAALKKAKTLDINIRARNILAWIKQKIN